MGRPVTLGQYPYTYLRTIIMKRNLLTRADYDKILKMTPDEIGKYLEEFEYKKEVDELAIEYQGVELLERTLLLNLGNVFQKLMHISPPDLRVLIELYLRRYEIYNIKTIVRGIFSETPPEEIRKHMFPTAVGNTALLDRLLAQKRVEDVVQQLDFLDEQHVRTALDHFRNHRTLVYIENILDIDYFSYVISQLRYLTMEGRLYKKFLLNEIDLLNVKLILQLKVEGIPDQQIAELVLSHGNLNKAFIDQLLKLDPERILKELETTEFRTIVEPYTKESGPVNFLDLEIAMDSYLMQQSRRLIRQFPMSVDVILGFMFLKDLEVKNLNRIVKAKQLGLPETFIEKAIVI
jgi:V/A-type H+-transporting ATPase subunit C